MARDRITGLVLREDAFEWTALSAKGGGKVERSNRIPLLDAVPDGEAVAGEGASGVVARIRPDCAHIKGSTVVAGMATDQLLLRVIELPVADAGEIASMVFLQVDKFSPFPVERMVVTHEVLHREEGTCRVLIAAVKKEAVDALGDVLKQADASTDRVDAAIMGWWWILTTTGKIGTAGRQVFLFLDAPDPEMIVTQDGLPVLFRSIAGIAGLAPEQAAGEVAGEIAHSLMSLELEHGGGAATTIYVWGREDSLPGVAPALEAECECKVESASLDAIPSVSEGLARRGMERGDRPPLDLTPAAWRDVEGSRRFRKQVILFSSAALLLWVLSLGGLLGGLAFQNHRLDTLKAEYESWSGPAREVGNMRRRVFMIERYMDVESSALECLRQISAVQPQGVELNSFTYRKGESLSIAGDADGVNMVYEFKNRLDESGLFEESDLIGPRRDPKRRRDLFEIVLRLPGGAE